MALGLGVGYGGSSGVKLPSWVLGLAYSSNKSVKYVDGVSHTCDVYAAGDNIMSSDYSGVFGFTQSRSKLAGKSFECYFVDLNHEPSKVIIDNAGLSTYSSYQYKYTHAATNITKLNNGSMCYYDYPMNMNPSAGTYGGVCYKFNLTFPSDASTWDNVMVSNSQNTAQMTNTYLSGIVIAYEV